MIKGLIGKKIEMTQTFDKHGRMIPVTKIQVRPNYVVQIKNEEKDIYKAVQIGYEEKKKPTKPLIGHSKQANLDFTPKHLREVESDGELKAGEKITLDRVFRPGVLVDVRGLSKGKGFSGVVKRWGFAGGPRTHGQSDRERAPGSIGATTTPGRVFKGLKMAGHMGDRETTVEGLEIIKTDDEKEEVWIKGSVPGARGTLLLVKKSKKKKRTYHEPEIPTTPQISAEKEKPVVEQEKIEGKPENLDANKVIEETPKEDVKE
jgi:large subunit ribosomal protein L3